MMSLTAGSDSSSSSGPRPSKLVDQHLFQRELLAAVEGDLQLGEHLADDRAEFLGQLVLAERRRGFGIDALEQAREHLLLDPVDRGLEAFGFRRGGRAAGVLAVVEAVHCAARRHGRGVAGIVFGSSGSSGRSSTGGNWSPPAGAAPPFMGRATPKLGR